MAVASLGRLTMDLVARIGEFIGPMNQAERKAKDSTDKMNKNFAAFKDQMNQSLNGTQFGSALDGITSKFSGLGGGVGVATASLAGMAVGGIGVAIGGLATLAIQTAKADADMAILANRANVGVESFQKLGYAAQQLGISQEQVGSIFADVQEKLGEFSATGGGGAADFFDALSNNTKMSADEIKNFSKTLQGKDGVEAVQLLKNKLDEVGASSQEQRFVFESLGSDLGNLLPLFAEGGSLLGEYGKALEDAGVIKSKEAIEQAQILAAQTQAVNLQFQGAKNQLVSGFTPALVDVAGALFGTSKNGVQFQSVGEGIGEILKLITHFAISTVTAIRVLGKGLGGLAAIGGTVAKEVGVFGANPIGLTIGMFKARKDVAALMGAMGEDISKTALDAGASLDALWDKNSAAAQSMGTLVDAQIKLGQAQAAANQGLATNTKEAEANAKAIEAQTKAAIKLNNELQVNAKVKANAAKYGFSDIENQYKLPSGLLSAINMQESRGKGDAIGPMTKFGTAKGGFQFLDGTAKRFGLVGDAVFNTGKSAEAAAKYFSFLYGKFGTWEKAISAYHAGEGNVERGTGLGPINREYVKNVMGYMDSALKGVGSTASDAVRYVEDAYKLQKSVAAKYMTEWEKLELEHAASVQEIKEAYAENDPSRQKYLDLQQAVYAQDLKQFTDNERLKREEAWRALDEIQGSLMESRVNSLAAASMTPDQLNAWQRTNIQQDGFSQLGDDFNNGVGAINGNEFLSEQERNSQLLALHDSFLLAKSALTQEYAQQDIEFAQAQQDLMLAQYSGIFSSTTDMMKNAFGEQSKAYAIAFAIQKGFAVGQAALSLAMNVAKASEIGFPYNLPMIAGAFAQGAQIVSIISGAQVPTGMAHDGIDYVPKEGTWLLDKGERVLSPRQNADLTRSLAERREVQQKPTSVENNMKVVILDDRSGIDQEMMGPSGEKAFLYHWKRNQSRLSR